MAVCTGDKDNVSTCVYSKTKHVEKLKIKKHDIYQSELASYKCIYGIVADRTVGRIKRYCCIRLAIVYVKPCSTVQRNRISKPKLATVRTETLHRFGGRISQKCLRAYRLQYTFSKCDE